MKSFLFILVIAGLAVGTTQAADDPEKIFKEVVELIQKGDTDAALEEAKWGVERLEQIKQDKVSDIFPAEIGDYKGGELTKNKAMGMMITERTYEQDGKSVTVSLIEGSDSGGAFAGLGALAQMAGVMGGGRKVRIQRRTGTAMAEGSSNTVSIGLESGGSLKFATDDMDIDGVIAFAEEFPVAKIDEARK